MSDTLPASWKVVDAFRTALADAGLVTHDVLVADGELHRFHVDERGIKSKWRANDAAPWGPSSSSSAASPNVITGGGTRAPPAETQRARVMLCRSHLRQLLIKSDGSH